MKENCHKTHNQDYNLIVNVIFDIKLLKFLEYHEIEYVIVLNFKLNNISYFVLCVKLTEQKVITNNITFCLVV